MDPLSIGLGIVGLGMSIFGSQKSSSDTSYYSGQIANTSNQITQEEQQIEAQKNQAMTLSTQRQQLETVRTAQRARSQAVMAGVTGNAQNGSGVAGGIGETEAEGTTGLLGINQNYQIGQNIFGINAKISTNKQQLATLQSQYQSAQASDQAMSSLGGAITKSAPLFGSLFKGFGGNSSSSSGGFNPFNTTGSLY